MRLQSSQPDGLRRPQSGATARFQIEDMLSNHEARYGEVAGRIQSSRRSGVHALEIKSAHRAFTAPDCDFHRFNFQLSGHMALIDFAMERQMKRKPGHLVPGNFAYIPSGTEVSAQVEGDDFHILQIMIPRDLMWRALEQVTGASISDDLMVGYIGAFGPNLMRIGQLLHQEYANPAHGDLEMLDCMAKMLCIELARHFGIKAANDPSFCGLSPDEERRVTAMMQDAVTADLNLGDIADALGLAPYQLTRRFKRHFGETPRDQLARLRLDRARELVSKSRKPLAEIAFECGFSSQAHMTTAFGKHYGFPPAHFRSTALSE